MGREPRPGGAQVHRIGVDGEPPEAVAGETPLPFRTPPPTPAPSLRSGLIRRLALAALVPVALLGVGELVTGWRTERQNLLEQLSMSAVLTASSVDEFTRAHMAAVGLLAAVPRRDPTWDADLRRLRAQYPALRTALVSDARGNIITSDPPSTQPRRLPVTDREYFRVPQRTLAPHLSNGFRGRGLGTYPVVAVSAPLLRNGTFDGVVEGSIHVSSFTQLRSEVLRRRGIEILILDRERRVVHASAGLPFAFGQDLSKATFLQRPAHDGHAVTSQVQDVLIDGTDAYVARSDTGAGWTVLLFAPEAAIGAPLTRRLAIFLGTLSLAALGTWIVVQLQMRRFAKLMENLLSALQRLALRGTVEPLRLGEVPVELRPLAQSIDDLASRLDNAQYDNLELDRLSRTDALTCVLNRRGFDEHLQALVSRDTGTVGVAVAVVAFDIDHFKQFNDRYGHLAGDAALRRVAGAISGCLRGKDDVVARTGGEEFVALLVGADTHTAYEVAERARHAVAELGIPHAKSPSGVMTISAGLHVAPAGAHPLALVEQADQALYRAKRGGRDRVAL